MAARLSVSRTSVWKLVERLRAEGHDVEARPNHGYRLTRRADVLTGTNILSGLETKWLGGQIEAVEVTDSTNLLARELAAKGAAQGLVVVAESQSAGRGRLGRTWSAPKGKAVLMSILLRPQLPASAVFGLTMAASVCLVRAVKSVTGLDAKVKWPNDVYVDDLKMAGILTEFTAGPDVVEYVIVGVGINVNQTEAELGRLDQPAVSLRTASGRRIDRAELLGEYLRQLEPVFERVAKGDTSSLRKEYERLNLVLGRQVTVSGMAEPVTGQAVGLAPDGSLIVKTAGGMRRTIVCGDVTLRNRA